MTSPGQPPVFAALETALRARFRTTPAADARGWDAACYRRTDIRLRWLATRLHTFAYLLDVRGASLDAVAAMGRDAREHAARSKGGLKRGLQTSTAALPILVVAEMTTPVRDWAAAPQSMDWGLTLFPVVVSVDREHAAFRTRPQRIGIRFEAFFRDLAEDLVGPVR